MFPDIGANMQFRLFSFLFKGISNCFYSPRSPSALCFFRIPRNTGVTGLNRVKVIHGECLQRRTCEHHCDESVSTLRRSQSCIHRFVYDPLSYMQKISIDIVALVL
jgi:hypothetical protein